MYFFLFSSIVEKSKKHEKIHCITFHKVLENRRKCKVLEKFGKLPNLLERLGKIRKNLEFFRIYLRKSIVFVNSVLHWGLSHQ